jgi:hypothetical protein
MFKQVVEEVRDRHEVLDDDYRLVCRVTSSGLLIERVRESTRLPRNEMIPKFTD